MSAFSVECLLSTEPSQSRASANKLKKSLVSLGGYIIGQDQTGFEVDQVFYSLPRITGL